ncbi:MAG: undecaprenyl-diphosphatase UppP [Planctomycetaceae bacterium]
MSILEAVVLGVVQGLTEFLPVSSTAHLRIVPAVCGWADPGAAFSAVLQMGTLAAIMLAMRRDIAALAAGCLRALRSGRPLGTPESRLTALIAVGTLPIVAAGFAFRGLIRSEARRLEVVITALLAATAVLAAAELVTALRRRHGRGGRDGLDAIRPADGITMGLAQALALIPGTSRSGITIAAGMLAGLDRRTAARFSFLLSLPAVAAAALLEGWQQRHEILGSGGAFTALAAGTLAAAVVGYASIRWLLGMLTGHTLWPFIAYRIALAAALAAALASGWIAVPAT